MSSCVLFGKTVSYLLLPLLTKVTKDPSWAVDFSVHVPVANRYAIIRRKKWEWLSILQQIRLIGMTNGTAIICGKMGVANKTQKRLPRIIERKFIQEKSYNKEHMLCPQFAVVRVRCNSNLGQGYAIFSVNCLKFIARKIWLITNFRILFSACQRHVTCSGRYS